MPGTGPPPHAFVMRGRARWLAGVDVARIRTGPVTKSTLRASAIRTSPDRSGRVPRCVACTAPVRGSVVPSGRPRTALEQVLLHLTHVSLRFASYVCIVVVCIPSPFPLHLPLSPAPLPRRESLLLGTRVLARVVDVVVDVVEWCGVVVFGGRVPEL